MSREPVSNTFNEAAGTVKLPSFSFMFLACITYVVRPYAREKNEWELT